MRVQQEPRTLFIFIADECHYGMVRDFTRRADGELGAASSSVHDECLNDATLAAHSNHVVTLLCSATPYCTLTQDSRVPKVRMSPDVLDGHVVIWEEALKPDKRLCADKGLEGWLKEEFSPPQSSKTYISMSSHLEEDRIRACGEWETLTAALELETHEAMAELLAVDYAFELILGCSADVSKKNEVYGKFSSGEYDLSGHTEMIPQYLKAVLDRELQKAEMWSSDEGDDDEKSAELRKLRSFRSSIKPPGRKPAPELLNHLLKKPALERPNGGATRESVEWLLDDQEKNIVVVRVTSTLVGARMCVLLNDVMKDLGITSFKVMLDANDTRDPALNDLKNTLKEASRKDLKMGTSSKSSLEQYASEDPAWVESVQVQHCKRGHSCEHRGSSGRKVRCQKGPEGNPCQKYEPGEAGKCRNCGHFHTKIASFEDLGEDISILLILVEKGRLGDTFPSTFRRLDLRGRDPRMNMSSVVQELGRLCRYDTIGSDRLPSAIIRRSTAERMKDVRNLPQLLAAHIRSLDVNMKVAEGSEADPPEPNYTSLLKYIRENTQAGKSAEVEDLNEGGAGNDGGKTSTASDLDSVSYDMNRRKDESTWQYLQETGYLKNADGLPHPREVRISDTIQQKRLVLWAEPQVGKTGAYLGLLQVLRKRLGPQPRSIRITVHEPDDGRITLIDLRPR